jgi:photosystem II stability/assembly factor-like uncharacterized protein
MIAIILLATIACVSGQEWSVAQPNLGTIMFGLDATSQDGGVIAGMTNGPGNLVYQFSENGDELELLLVGTEQGQPFMILSARSHHENETVVTGIGYGRAFPAVMYTNDGGETWPSSSTHASIWGLYQDCSKVYDGNSYVVTGDWIVYAEPPAPYGTGVGISTDGGDVWTMSGLNSWTWDSWARYSAFFNNTHGFTSGGYWPLAATQDERVKSASVIIGDESNEHYLPLSQHVLMRADKDQIPLKYNTPKNDYNAFIAKTSDGGQTWTPVFESFNEYYFNQIQFINEFVGFVVGEGHRAVILKTTDGGNTWREVFQSTRSLVAMKMVSDQEGWAGGAIYGATIRAYLVRTTDGGETWAEFPTEDLPYSVWNIEGVDPAHVYSVAFNSATTALLRFT